MGMFCDWIWNWICLNVKWMSSLNCYPLQGIDWNISTQTIGGDREAFWVDVWVVQSNVTKLSTGTGRITLKIKPLIVLGGAGVMKNAKKRHVRILPRKKIWSSGSQIQTAEIIRASMVVWKWIWTCFHLYWFDVKTNRTCDARLEKTDLKVFVVVIPKKGWARMAAPILLWVWHRLLENMIYEVKRLKF